jgi:hypothetical protein
MSPLRKVREVTRKRSGWLAERIASIEKYLGIDKGIAA